MKFPAAVLTWKYLISPHGELTHIDDEVHVIAAECEETWIKKPDAMSILLSTLCPFFLAVTFCHCKNVKVVAQQANRATRRRAQREGTSLLKLHTLEIAPVKKMLDATRAASGVDLKNALHICRGHFKDYRERGLFGKVKGLFWWDMYIRGEPNQGSVGKDYTVAIPNNGAST
jgi:hypothetical protein